MTQCIRLSLLTIIAIGCQLLNATNVNINIVANTQVCGAGNNSTINCNLNAKTDIGAPVANPVEDVL